MRTAARQEPPRDARGPPRTRLRRVREADVLDTVPPAARDEQRLALAEHAALRMRGVGLRLAGPEWRDAR